jgi:hypothetical protein
MSRNEDEMENMVTLGQTALGLAVFFIGVAVLWFASIYQSNEDELANLVASGSCVIPAELRRDE